MKQHILLIEDNQDIRENTAEILELANFKVSTAENGKKGMEIALKEKIDLIICDIVMPILDGYGVLHMASKNAELDTIPFIFLTAKSDRSDFRKAMEMGADDYITKPFSDIELLNAIDSRMNRLNIFQKNTDTDEENLNDMLQEFEGSNALQKITENRPENKYKKKQIIYSRGNHPQKLFFINSGKVKTYISNEEGKELTIGLFSTGDFLGYTALLEEGIYKETAVALDECVIAEIPIDSFRKVLYLNPDATKKIIQLMAKTTREKEKQMLDIAYNSLRKRVANALMTLIHKFRTPEEQIFSIHLSREDLANLAGTATESLIRTLSDFKTEKLVDINGSKITILNEKNLAAMLN